MLDPAKSTISSTNRTIVRPNKLPLVILSLCSAILFLGSCSNNSAPEASKSNPADKTSAPAAKSAQIDINSASIAELDKLELPGTKPSLSERIQGGRPYKTIEDLVTKKVISPEEFKLIKGLTIAVQSK